MAQETTITGSIGVIANIMTLQDLMTKIGVKPVTLIAEDSPEKSVANDIFRNWTNKDKQLVTGFLDTMYNVFLSRVKEGRSHVITDAGKLASVANGSAYTAQEALENGLIDSIGYLDDAILVAEQRTGVSNGSSTIVRYSRAVPVLGGLLGAKGRGMTATDLRSIIHEFSMPRLMYLYNQ
jgi:protease-4